MSNLLEEPIFLFFLFYIALTGIIRHEDRLNFQQFVFFGVLNAFSLLLTSNLNLPPIAQLAPMVVISLLGLSAWKKE